VALEKIRQFFPGKKEGGSGNLPFWRKGGEETRKGGVSERGRKGPPFATGKKKREKRRR